MNLQTKVSELPGVGKYYKTKLEKVGVNTVYDLVYYFPFRFKDLQNTQSIRNIRVGENVSLTGQITKIENVYTRTGKRLQVAQVSDGTGKLSVIWFNQVYLPKNLPPGTAVSLAGKVGFWGRKVALVAPDHEKLELANAGIHTQGLVPVYPETEGLSSKWIRNKIADVFPKVVDNFGEPLTDELLGEVKLMGLGEALKQIHFPDSKDKNEAARNRLAFDELLRLQLASLERKATWEKNTVSNKLTVSEESVANFYKLLPFAPTKSQAKVIETAANELTKNKPMNMLLEGDVGSGKTVICAFVAYATFLNNLKTVVMAPTQILANQHYETLKAIFKDTKIEVSLLTAQTKTPNVEKSDLVVGTHSLIHKKVALTNVASVVIDEQHRFGVEQRKHLIKKSKNKQFAPHVLTMTATPIPRTVALTVYGDLDLSTLDELPPGRQKIHTIVVSDKKRTDAYNWLEKEIQQKGVQAFVVCPLIEPSDAELFKDVKSATTEYQKLASIFSKLKIGLLHGKLSSKEKSRVLKSFSQNKINILVSTPVIEVGIDFPNATIMLIESADRFGLAALHQLRGRVGRGDKKSYCLLFSESKGPKTKKRMTAMTKGLTGFELAEIDLHMRGPGEVFGTLQHGFGELKVASWQDTQLIKDTREFAKNLLKNPQKYAKVIKSYAPLQEN